MPTLGQASNEPVPDDFDATERLITGLFTAPPGTAAVTALRESQHALMDESGYVAPILLGRFRRSRGRGHRGHPRKHADHREALEVSR